MSEPSQQVELPDWGGVIEGCYDFPPTNEVEEMKWHDFFASEGFLFNDMISNYNPFAAFSCTIAWSKFMRHAGITKFLSVVDDAREKTHVFVRGIPPGGVKA